jgi:hypothetical protein
MIPEYTSREAFEVIVLERSRGKVKTRLIFEPRCPKYMMEKRQFLQQFLLGKLDIYM